MMRNEMKLNGSRKLPRLHARHLGAATALVLLATFSQAQSLCESGFADNFPCDRMDLMSHMSNAQLMGTGANDVWGWTDPETGVEYALIGERQGLAMVDLSEPTDPVLVAFMYTQTSNSTWRDMKVYENHVYVVSEANGHGLQVLDLNQLRDLTEFPTILEPTTWVSNFSDAHNVVIDEESALLYAVGTNLAGGGLVVFDISAPANPTLLGVFGEAGYTHDAQGVVYAGPDQAHLGESIVFAANASQLAILNTTDPTDIGTISTITYDYSYTHQCWLTEDHRYLLLGDELDEQNQGFNTRTLIFDVQDLENPFLIGEHFSDVAAIDHNQYVVGNLVFQSNYRAGLRMLTLTDVSIGELSEVGYFDVDPASNSAQFSGSWSNYPYFESGLVVVTSIEGGIYVVRPKFIEFDVATPVICPEEALAVSFEIFDGLLPPYELSLTNLPEGAQVMGFPDQVDGPGTYVFSVSGWGEISGEWTLGVEVQSALNTVSNSFAFEITPGNLWYEDADLDGFGNPEVTTQACSAPVGFVSTAEDCDDTSAAVYPGAPGSGQGIDNNCDGIIEGDELNQVVDCPGDFNSDGAISVADLLVFLGEFGCTIDCNSDFDSDGTVAISDLLGFLSIFGQDCPEE